MQQYITPGENLTGNRKNLTLGTCLYQSVSTSTSKIFHQKCQQKHLPLCCWCYMQKGGKKEKGYLLIL